MPHVLPSADALAYLQQFLVPNKARGMMAELALDAELTASTAPEAKKIIDGAWLVAPKVDHFYQLRHAIFVLPELYATDGEVRAAIQAKEADRAFQALATFLTRSGVRLLVTAARSSTANVASIQWQHHQYFRECLVRTQEHQPFASWPGRGRASHGAAWQADVLARFGTLPAAQTTALTLRQAFFYGYLKQTLHKSLADPYDVDAFIVGYTGTVLPLEVKEKSATKDGAFGLDVGRILMMLRLCLATDRNGAYLIREVDTTPARAFLRWRFVTLSDFIMACSWNLQGGGASMSGGATQTVMLPGALFRDFTPEMLSEDWLEQHGNLQGAIRARVAHFATQLETLYPHATILQKHGPD